jgi:hypothetical protein
MPAQNPPEFYGIQTDKVPLGEIVSKDSPPKIDKWFARSFAFRSQGNLLGRVTAFHEKFSYLKKTIHGDELSYLADIHDYLVDYLKQGYKYTEKEFQMFLHRTPGFPSGELPTPAYKIAMKAGFDCSRLGEGRPGLPPVFDRDHAIDRLVFEEVKPHIDETIQLIEKRLITSTTEDDDLSGWYTHVLERANQKQDTVVNGLRAELANLRQQLGELRARYNRDVVARMDKDDFSAFSKSIQECRDAFEDIRPKWPHNLEVLLQWMPEMVANATWGLLKASALHALFHHQASFVFHVAGKELVELKTAASRSGRRVMTTGMWAQMKPRKLKNTEDAHGSKRVNDEEELRDGWSSDDSIYDCDDV